MERKDFYREMDRLIAEFLAAETDEADIEIVLEDIVEVAA